MESDLYGNDRNCRGTMLLSCGQERGTVDDGINDLFDDAGLP